MKSLVFSLTILFIFSSCNKQEQPKPVSLQKTTAPVSEVVPSAAKSGSSATSDDFSDLKKEDDESCDSEEELLKKQIEKAQKAKTQGVKLQGAGDEGCTVN
ncbi:MAG: hypothetical protein EP319_05200 [Deltaproteobacteria bacterium]|nr:MAG: hypothetical protein EP319_05200 [Deltaproteobacteria bacterium]